MHAQEEIHWNNPVQQQSPVAGSDPDRKLAHRRVGGCCGRCGLQQLRPQSRRLSLHPVHLLVRRAKLVSHRPDAPAGSICMRGRARQL